MADREDDLALDMAGAAEAARATAKPVVHALTAGLEGRMALATMLCRLEYARQVILLGTQDGGVPLTAILATETAARVAVSVERIIAGKLTSKEAGLLTGPGWQTSFDKAEAEAKQPITGEMVESALKNLSDAQAVVNKLRD